LIKPSQHRVGDVIEGTYTVYFRDILIGHLILSGGRYSYKPQDKQEITEDEQRMANLAAKIIFFGDILMVVSKKNIMALLIRTLS